MQKLTDNIYVLVVIAMVGTFILVTAFMIILFQSQRRLMQQREISRMNELEHQKLLLHSIIESQDAERIRIGRDLHDDIGTALSNLHITIERFFRIPYSIESFKDFKATTKTVIDQTIKNVRNISHNLSPEILTTNSPSEAIEELCELAGQAEKTRVFLKNSATVTLDSFDLIYSLSAYRIIEELLTNTMKHANATEVNLLIFLQDTNLVMSYHDNGKGLNVEISDKKGRGISNIESRLSLLNGSFIMDNENIPGFSICIKIPVNPRI